MLALSLYAARGKQLANHMNCVNLIFAFMPFPFDFE